MATMAFCLPMRLLKRSTWADPLGVMFDRTPGRLTHYPAQITAPLLGDAPTAIGFPGLVDTCPQASIAHEMLGRPISG